MTQKLILAGAILALGFTGCATKRVTQPNGTVVTVINQDNLDLDAAALQGATSIAVSVAVAKDPAAVPALKNAAAAINGILAGSNQQTTQQVIDLLKLNGSPALQAQVDAVLKAASALEQKLLAKYGSTVAGQITVELTKAIYAGLVIGLQGH